MEMRFERYYLVARKTVVWGFRRLDGEQRGREENWRERIRKKGRREWRFGNTC